MVFHAMLNETVLFGSTVTQYLLFLAVLGLGILTGKLFSSLYQSHVKREAKKTGTRLDDMLLKTVEKPLIFLAFVISLVLGRSLLSPSPAAAQLLDTVTQLLMITAVAWTGIRFTNAAFRSYIANLVDGADSRLYEQLVPVVEKIVKATIIVLAVLFGLDSFGYDITALLTSLGIGGVAVAFAARETIADVFGGFTILTAQPFILGDAVQIGDVEGRVEEIGLRFTRVRAWDKQLVTLPNAKVASSNIVNVSAEPGRRVVSWLGLSYDDAADRLEEVADVLKEAVEHVDGVDTDTVNVWFWEYGDSALKYRLQYFIADKDNLFDVKHRANLAVKEVCDRHGIDMPYPTQTIRFEEDQGQ